MGRTLLAEQVAAEQEIALERQRARKALAGRCPSCDHVMHGTICAWCAAGDSYCSGCGQRSGHWKGCTG